MEWDKDEELQAIFRTEMEERAPRLVAGAEAMIAGTLSEQLAQDSAREAHTVKGTARVMGFHAIADAGAKLETDWKAVADHALDASPELGARLLAVSAHLLPAIDADADEGTPELSAALRALIEGTDPQPVTGLVDAPIRDIALEEPASDPPPVLEVVEGFKGVVDDPVDPNSGDLGGLLSASAPFSSGETTGVNTAKLYRLINRVAELRLDAEALAGTVEALRLAATSSPREVASLATRWESAVGDISESVGEIQRQAVTLVAVPLSTVTGTMPGLVRFLAKKTGKEVRLEVVDDDIDVDLQILDRLADVLRNLIVNAVEHGIQPPETRIAEGKAATGTVSINAFLEDTRLVVKVSDDGAGFDWDGIAEVAVRDGALTPEEATSEEVLRSLLFERGLSTSPTHSELSGSGQGFRAVSELIREMRGSVEVETTPGAGTAVTVTVPAFQSLQRALIVKAGGQRWGVAEPAVLDRFPVIDTDQVTLVGGTEIVWRDGMLPLRSFAQAAGLQEIDPPSDIVVLATQAGPVALGVSAIIGVREVATKGLGPLVSGTDLITGAALLGGGELALMLDANALGEASRAPSTRVDQSRLPVILVVDDSPGVQQIVAGALAAGGFAARVAGSTAEGLDILDRGGIDGLVVDYSMPGSDGVELVNEVRRRFGGIPVVMMSAVAARADQDRARAAGVDAYFDKSDFREGALVSTLHSLLERADRGREANAR